LKTVALSLRSSSLDNAKVSIWLPSGGKVFWPRASARSGRTSFQYASLSIGFDWFLEILQATGYTW
jgi:hypothetical protein